MGQGYFRPVEGEDLIVHWSTFWDFPIAWGTRSEFKLTEAQAERLERFGSTWADLPMHYDDPKAGLILRMPVPGDELGGYLYFNRVPEVLDVLTTAFDEKKKADVIQNLLIEGHWMSEDME